MKALLIKAVVVCLVAAICGVVAGGLFSPFFYNLIPQHMRVEVYLSDTPGAAKLRFWIAFAVGAVFGIVWLYRIVKDMEL